jgi:glycosyltransferase involved in cell wall biosynthesis
VDAPRIPASGNESALALSHRPIEILVVDNAPTDEVYRWLEHVYPTVKAIKTFRPLPLPVVRNMLVASARGKHVVFHDDDSRFSETDMRGRGSDPGKGYHLADIVMNSGAMLLKAPWPDVLFWYPYYLFRQMLKVIVLRRRPALAFVGLFDAVAWLPSFIRERRSISRRDFRRWRQTRVEYQRGTYERLRGRKQHHSQGAAHAYHRGSKATGG